MEIISVVSFKGGTAKTSTSLHLGSALACFHDKKVLLIDFDAQANLTAGLGFDPDEHDSLAAVFLQKKSLEEVILKTKIKNLDLIPADTWLERIENAGDLATDRYSHERLKKLLSSLNYDCIFIDTPPSLCWLTESALIASSKALIAATAEFYSVKGLERLQQFLEQIQERQPLEILGILLSFWNARGKNNLSFVKVIEKIFPEQLLNAKIRKDTAVSDAAIAGIPVFLLDDKSRAAEDYMTASVEVLQRIYGKNPQSLRKTARNSET